MEAFAVGAAAIIANMRDAACIISALTLQARKIFPEPAAAAPTGQKRPPSMPQKSLREKLARFVGKFRASLSRKDSGCRTARGVWTSPPSCSAPPPRAPPPPCRRPHVPRALCPPYRALHAHYMKSRRTRIAPVLHGVSFGRLSQLLSKAGVAELADALDLGSSGATREGSIPFARTTCLGARGALDLSWRNVGDIGRAS